MEFTLTDSCTPALIVDLEAGESVSSAGREGVYDTTVKALPCLPADHLLKQARLANPTLSQ